MVILTAALLYGFRENLWMAMSRMSKHYSRDTKCLQMFLWYGLHNFHASFHIHVDNIGIRLTASWIVFILNSMFLHILSYGNSGNITCVFRPFVQPEF